MAKETSDFKQTLWKTADSLRAQMDAAEYKHIVLGLIFLKYISDSFTEQKERIKALVTDSKSDFFISENLSDIDEKDLEDRDYYTQDNVFWVPESARWETLRAQGKQPDIGAIIDSAMSKIETENKSLKGKLDKRFGRTELGAGKLGELIDLISTIGFTEEQNAGDMLGEVYEYFLGQFASAEGKKGGQFYTPRHIVKTLVAVLSPHKGRVYDPCCGSGGMFIQSEDFVTSHGGKRDDISIYGQESNPTTWRLAAMNLAIRGLAADLGKEPGDTFGNDQHPDTKFDYIIANPPFNISDWGGEKYEDDPRWVYGRPPVGNANYAWLQHILWKLGPNGKAGVVLANGALTSDQGDEDKIRKGMIEDDVIDSIILLPEKLFLNTGIAVSLWFLNKDKKNNNTNNVGNILFVDARSLAKQDPNKRTRNIIDNKGIEAIKNEFHKWNMSEDYISKDSFSINVSIEEVLNNNSILNPSKYIKVNKKNKQDENNIDKLNSHFDKYKSSVDKTKELDIEILEMIQSVFPNFKK
tara:strand:+ start:445 stop:2019 length:1575 start_codon:yes stop_codon:yes gene_type:complete